MFAFMIDNHDIRQYQSNEVLALALERQAQLYGFCLGSL